MRNCILFVFAIYQNMASKIKDTQNLILVYSQFIVNEPEGAQNGHNSQSTLQ